MGDPKQMTNRAHNVTNIAPVEFDTSKISWLKRRINFNYTKANGKPGTTTAFFIDLEIGNPKFLGKVRGQIQATGKDWKRVARRMALKHRLIISKSIFHDI